jgi:hypothetical protein
MVGAEFRRIKAGGLLHQQGFVILPAWRCRIERDEGFEAGSFTDVNDKTVAGRFDDGGGAVTVTDRKIEHISAQFGVERDRDDTGAHGAVHNLDELEAVADAHGEAVAGLEPHGNHEVGSPVEPVFHLAIGHLARGALCEIDHRDAIGHGERGFVAEVAQIILTSGVHHDWFFRERSSGKRVTSPPMRSSAMAVNAASPFSGVAREGSPRAPVAL